MSEKLKSVFAFIFMLSALAFLGVMSAKPPQTVLRTIPPESPKINYSVQRTGIFEVAKVFGRSAGCENADYEWMEITSKEAMRVGLDPKLVAATIAVESGCDSFAVSYKGAVGAMQILPRAWKDKYDFQKVNLLNKNDNIRVGSEILSSLVVQYGIEEGLRRYQGLGPGGDGMYVEKILRLAGRK